MDTIAALERSYDHTGSLVADLTAADLEQATGCPGWDVRATLDHLLGVIRMFTNAAKGAPVPEELTTGLVGTDARGALAAEVKTSLETWREPGALDAPVATPLGQLQGHMAVMLSCMEATAHTFDMANAIGRPTAIDPDIAAFLLPFVEQLPLADIRAAGEFGPEVTVLATASDGDRLLGLLGRRPSVPSHN